MTLEWIIDHFWAAGLALVGWFVNTAHRKQEKLQEQLHALEKQLPEKYVNVARFESLAETLQTTLNRIEDKLDRKVDK